MQLLPAGARLEIDAARIHRARNGRLCAVGDVHVRVIVHQVQVGHRGSGGLRASVSGEVRASLDASRPSIHHEVMAEMEAIGSRDAEQRHRKEPRMLALPEPRAEARSDLRDDHPLYRRSQSAGLRTE